MKRKVAIPVTFVSLALIVACSSPEETTPDDDAAGEQTEAEPTNDESDEGDEGDAGASLPGASRDNPADPGETVLWEDYEVTLGETDYDAAEWAMQAYADDWYDGDLSQVEPLEDGVTYVAAPIKLTYVGEDVGEPDMDVTASYVTAEGNVADQPPTYAAPDDLRDASELYPEASVETHIMVEVPEGAAEGGVWRLYDTFADDRVEVFFASE